MKRIHVYPTMRGHGWGGLFSRLTSYVKPLLKSAVRAARPVARETLRELGEQGLNVATSTLSDIAEGNNVKEALKRNVRRGATRAKSTLKTGVKRAAKQSISQVQKDIKRRKQTGKGKKKKTPPKKRRRINRGIFKST